MAGTANTLVGVGLYRLREASKLTGVPAARVSRWVNGYTFTCRGMDRHSEPVWVRQIPDIDGAPVLGFQDLMELRFVDAFRRYGVSFQTIRLAAERASQLFATSHPFSTRRFRTDGRTVFLALADETGEQVLIDLKRNQHAFSKVLEPYLYAGLDFSPSGQAQRWWPSSGQRQIVLDPNRSLGKPIVAGEGIATSVLAEAFEVERSFERVAAWYEVAPQSVRAAVEFEAQLAA
jgi:uncharacterized protein (DUF433 family)